MLLIVIISCLAVDSSCTRSTVVGRFSDSSRARCRSPLLPKMLLFPVTHFTSVIRTTGHSLISVRTTKLVGITHGIHTVSSLGIRTVDLHILGCQGLWSIIPAIRLGLSECIYTGARRMSNRARKSLRIGIHVCFTCRQFHSVLFKATLIVLVGCDHFKFSSINVEWRQTTKFRLQRVWARLLLAQKSGQVSWMMRMRWRTVKRVHKRWVLRVHVCLIGESRRSGRGCCLNCRSMVRS